METFVIQIGEQPRHIGEKSQHELRGVVEHVGSGRRQPFANARELLTFLRANHRPVPKEDK
jgi:hypothetical protein